MKAGAKEVLSAFFLTAFGKHAKVLGMNFPFLAERNLDDGRWLPNVKAVFFLGTGAVADSRIPND